MKRLLLSVGSIAVLATPLVGVVSCKDDSAYSYNAEDKSLSLEIHASVSKFQQIAISFDETTKVANAIASGLHDHTDVDKIKITYSVSGDSSMNKTSIVTPGDMYNFLNVCGRMLDDGDNNPNNNPQPLEFGEILFATTFAQVISNVPDYKYISLINASTYISTNTLLIHNVNPGNTTATNEFRSKISKADRVTMLSYFIVWQSL